MKTKWLWLIVLTVTSAGGYAKGLQPVLQEQAAEKESRDYMVFRPTAALPLSGGNIQLTLDFVLKITPDSVICHLPYYGRAYQAAYGTAENVMDFISVRFSYTKKRSGKGVEIITITPDDNREVRQLSITLYGDGYALVDASFNQRQSIAYRGQIMSGNKEKQDD